MAGGSKTERRKFVPRHIRLDHSMTGSDSWIAMDPVACKLIVVLMRLEDGKNNGELFLSVRAAAKDMGVSINTAARAFKIAEQHGFIKPTAKGYFQVKGGPATCWRLTALAAPGMCGPTHDYRDWKPSENKTRSQILTSAVSKTDTRHEKSALAVSNIDTIVRGKPTFSVNGPVSNTDTQTLYQGDGLSNRDHPFQKYPAPSSARRDQGTDAAIRVQLNALVGGSPAGIQRQLAKDARIPPSTLNQFKTGDLASLSSAHRVRLLASLAKFEKEADDERHRAISVRR